MLYRKRRRRNRFRLRRWHIVAVAAIITLVCAVKCFETQVAAFSDDYIQSFAKQISTDALCEAVTEKINELNYSYSDIAKVTYSENGAVQSIETDSTKINILKAEVTKAAQNEIVKVKRSQAKIPLGAFTKLSLLSNMGPDVSLGFCLTGSFNSRIESELENAGINRTIHHIKLVVTSKIVTASVDYHGEIEFETDFEIAQSVIAGDIPTIYGGIYTAY